MSKRITIAANDGTPPEVYQRALEVGLAFATDYSDRKPGQRRAVVCSDRWTAADWPTRDGQRYDYIVWWTARRAIVVRVVSSAPPVTP